MRKRRRRRRRQAVRRIWFSLDDPVLPRENAAGKGWKSLDFLGFSRPNRAFSICYEGFPKKIFRAMHLTQVAQAVVVRPWLIIPARCWSFAIGS